MRVKEIVPQAIDIHCFAHVLNLVLVDCAKNVSHAAKFFALLESLYVFVSSTKAHVLFVRKQSELHPTQPKRELQRLSDTRWACRYSAVDTMYHTYGALLATLEEIADGNDHGKAVEAKGLLLQVKSFSFLLLIIFDRVLSCTKRLSDLLQSQHCDLAKATDLVSATIETLQEFRLDDSWKHLLDYSQQVAELHEIPVTSLQQKRHTRLPSRFEDTVVLESTGSRACLSTGDQYKVDVYLPILDSFLVELKERFNSRNMEIMKAIQACSPQSKNFLHPDSFKSLSENYEMDHASLTMESMLAKRTLASKDRKPSVMSFLHFSPSEKHFLHWYDFCRLQ